MAVNKIFTGKIIVVGENGRIFDRNVIKREAYSLSRSFAEAKRWGIGYNHILVKEDNETVEIQLDAEMHTNFPLSDEKTWEEINLQDLINLSEQVYHWDQEEWLESHIEFEGGQYNELILEDDPQVNSIKNLFEVLGCPINK